MINKWDYESYDVTTCIRMALHYHEMYLDFSFGKIDPMKDTLVATQKGKLDEQGNMKVIPLVEHQCFKQELTSSWKKNPKQIALDKQKQEQMVYAPTSNANHTASNRSLPILIHLNV